MMNAKKFKRIIYLISVTVLFTVAIQVYRNVQNYQVNKQRFMLDVQQALDLAVENYYSDRAKREVKIFTTESFSPDSIEHDSLKWQIEGLTIASDTGSTVVRQVANFRNHEQMGRFLTDSSNANIQLNINNAVSIDTVSSFQITNRVQLMLSDSSELRNMAKKIFLSLVNTSLDFEELDTFLVRELDRKKIEMGYLLIHKTRDSVFYSSDDRDVFQLATNSKSTYLPRDQELGIEYENASLIILKRGMLDLIISLLIIATVVGALLYLYRIIAEQKELAEIKNDLISNITHEFKTPIATISTAIEGISNFNKANDPEKTAKYLDISSGQLKKLNGMVEKLLETATLDSDELDLSLEPVELVVFTRQIFERFHLLKGEKELSFETSLVDLIKEVDAFHLENAISNLIDNALKYGGNRVSINLGAVNDRVIWTVTDNGGNLDKAQQARIFDKFYRVPTGNLHDVKGFGIGLYYTKKIAEKHNGSIDLDVVNDNTIFTLSI